MSDKITLDIDLNRVEGDLEFQLDLQDDKVVDARCKGIMYRGFEQLLIGRDSLDSVVMTSRICGICGTAHMYSAALALEQIWQIDVPPLATLVRNLCLGAESVQSDLRHSLLMFTPDFCNPQYAGRQFYAEAMSAFEPFKGHLYRDVLRFSRHLLEIVAIFGGQWPHSSYMVPGGVVSEPTASMAAEALDIVYQVAQWYEQKMLGCSLDEWLQLETADDFFAWLEQHPDTGVGLFSRISRDVGLQFIGSGAANYLSYGAYCDPDSWGYQPHNHKHLARSGFYRIAENGASQLIDFDHQLIQEHVKHSWFYLYEGGKHPYDGETQPNYMPDSHRYTWAKAPRYNDEVVQTGPLAELVIDGDPLLTSLLHKEGDNTWLRQFARFHRPVRMLKQLADNCQQIMRRAGEPHINPLQDSQRQDGDGYGLVQAARGALGHWVKVRDGKISKYQIITPTAWNASPKDSQDRPGHWEKSVVGLQLNNADDPLEIGHIVRSHDACLVCTVHMLDPLDKDKPARKENFPV